MNKYNIEHQLKMISYRMNCLIRDNKHKDDEGNKSAEYIILEFEFEKLRRQLID